MKRSIHIILSLVLMSLCACTGIDTGVRPDMPDPRYPYIFFDAEVASGTKSNLVEGDALPSDAGTSFGVFGYREGESVFEPEVVMNYRPSDGAAFIYDNLATWMPEVSHEFYAYYPYETAAITAAGLTMDDSKPYVKYVQPETLEDMVDVMTASSNASASPVLLNFQHRLFSLDVVIKDGQISDDAYLELSEASVVFTDVVSEAELYYDGNHAVIGDESGYVAAENVFDPAVTVEPGGEGLIINGDHSFLFLPCDELTMVCLLNGNDEWGELGDWALGEDNPGLVVNQKIAAPAGGFKAGQKYVVVITKTDADGFVAQVGEWADGGNINFTFK